MNVSALLTSAGINIGVCALLLSLYSVLRKQPGNFNVYFARRIAQEHIKLCDSFTFERLVPSPSWIVKAWGSSEEEILSVAGVDAVVFLRILVFSIRIFSIAAVICMFVLLPLNYHGQEMYHIHIKNLPSTSLDMFTIGNVKTGFRWLWVHCAALYIITFSACILLYFEYKSISKLRLAHLIGSPPNPSHFTVLVRAIPRCTEETLSDAVKNFFTNYHPTSYLTHQMIYRTGKVEKLMSNAARAYRKLASFNPNDLTRVPSRFTCRLCGCVAPAEMYTKELQNAEQKVDYHQSGAFNDAKECSAAFVFFKNRYSAIVAAQVLQSSNPMTWVTDLAPEPHDVYWSNLWIPFGQLWIRRIVTLLASVVFMFLFLIPVTFVQGLTQLEQLQHTFPFLRNILKERFVIQLVSGYLPSVILQLFLYIVPPAMMLFSAIEGSISHSGRKRSACCKVLYFTIWNVFFVNVLSGSVISQLNAISSPKNIPTLLAKAIPSQATFFITYVLTSGWASLSSEVMQLFALIWNLVMRLLRIKDEEVYMPSFPYHTEVPKLLLFGLLGFTCSILAPLILPFLLVYFFLGYVVYRNQILNVYCTKYESGGRIWPVVHNTTVFSLVLAQIIALGVFGLKDSPVASGFTIPLLVCTLLFNEYCRQRFSPIFDSFSAQDLMEMDRGDEIKGRLDEVLQKLPSAYCQHVAKAKDESEISRSDLSVGSSQCLDIHESFNNGIVGRLPVSTMQQIVQVVKTG
ncbi:unnamed protein product [Victoria cruziana]